MKDLDYFDGFLFYFLHFIVEDISLYNIPICTNSYYGSFHYINFLYILLLFNLNYILVLL